jgi:hypothetical protein
MGSVVIIIGYILPDAKLVAVLEKMDRDNVTSCW